MLLVIGIIVPSYDLSNRVAPGGKRERRAGDVERGKCRVSREDRVCAKQQIQRN